MTNRSTRSPRSLRKRLAPLTSLIAVPLFAAPYALTANASPLEGTATLSTQSQQLEVSSRSSASEIGRDSFTIEDLPRVGEPYARTADTFVNDPTSAVQWPFTRGVPISSWFGYRQAPCRTCSTYHSGLDMNPGLGTPIQAIADGVVTEVGDPSGELGVYAVVEHRIEGQIVDSVYAHMLPGSLALKVGQVVEVTDTVGLVGNSGESTGPHLHFTIRIDGQNIDPYAYMKSAVGS